MSADYAVTAKVDVESRDDLIAAFGDHRGSPIRLWGSGSAQPRLPAPGCPVTVVSTRSMNRIVRLEPEDLTCSVEPGVTREQLDAELAAVSVHLPCPGAGTLGGVFATGEYLAFGPASMSARNLLLGVEGVLAEGLPFKAGSRVVKSVAGFDVPKLFVGSRGTLFAATLLHLKLRPRPPHSLRFRRRADDRDQALEVYGSLRRSAVPPTALFVQRIDGAFTIAGRFDGHAETCQRELSERRLETTAADPGWHLAKAGVERVQGLCRPSRLAELFALLPADCDVTISGTGQFEADLDAGATEPVLRGLAEHAMRGELRIADAARRGLATPIDPVIARLQQRLKSNLDPAGSLR